MERGGQYEHPIAHVSQPFSLQATGISPKVQLLNMADLLTPGTVVPGSPGSLLATTNLEERSIIGTDNRFLQVKTGNPWDYIGNFAWGVGNDGWRCSASLVGPRHLATARHCFNRTNSQITYQFRPNYDQGTRGYTTAQVTHALFLPGEVGNICSWGEDWAVMILDQRIGDKYGYFGVKQFDGTKVGRPNFWHEGKLRSGFSSSGSLTVNKGYPNDLGGTERPYVQQGITGKNFTECNSGVTGPISTDADTFPGQSGGPLWLLPEADGVRYLYGVLAGGSQVESLFSGRIAFVNAVAQARRDFP
jgi:V8-like Glu-specific endopeptidase